MSRLTNLIAHAKAIDPQMGADLEREFRALSSRLSFGLNFERHRPEAVELPQRPVRRGDKVRMLPPRGSAAKGDQRLWLVRKIAKDGEKKRADLELLDESAERSNSLVDDLVVVAEFRDIIYPGLVSTGKVSRGGEKPCHTVINGENFHVLKALTWTHRGKVDAIYIDPPYNTGAKDWKYNNDYVESDDLYRHSKWLAMMERRLLLAKELLNPADSVLIVTIDEKEYLRLGLLLEQVFPDARIQMVTSVIKPGGVSRDGFFARSSEYLFFVQFGACAPAALPLGKEWGGEDIAPSAGDVLYWNTLWRSGSSPQREGHADTFYPIFVDKKTHVISRIGDPIGEGVDRKLTKADPGTFVVWPIRNDGSEGRWQLGAPAARTASQLGYIKLGRANGEKTRLYYLARGERRRIEEGTIRVIGRRADGSVIGEFGSGNRDFVPTESWSLPSHDATRHGSMLLSKLLPKRAFPYPKSLYAVEDTLRFMVAKKPTAIVLDFFSGSGTTAHALMRLNKQDGGQRQCISVTNNEVGADEQKALRESRLRPGDPDWERLGICDYITKPRVQAAISGTTPDGQPIKGDYKFTDEFPMAAGFEENAEFFTLTYETPVAVSYQTAFSRIAPLLWLRAGSVGRRIEKVPASGWDLVDTYGLLVNLDNAKGFLKATRKAKDLRIAYIVTDDERRFQALARRLPEGVEAIRLYESYLTNFAFANGDVA